MISEYICYPKNAEILKSSNMQQNSINYSFKNKHSWIIYMITYTAEKPKKELLRVKFMGNIIKKYEKHDF